MSLDLSSLNRAIQALRDAIEVEQGARTDEAYDDRARIVLRAGVIQSFEFTYEQCWKFMRRWLSLNAGRAYVDGVARRELFRVAARNGLIDDVERWMDAHHARNRTSHTYDGVTADEVLLVAREFLHDAERLYPALAARND
jgi:nucleotidyltransferase substrate binding protein (TIGR01987 family)